MRLSLLQFMIATREVVKEFGEDKKNPAPLHFNKAGEPVDFIGQIYSQLGIRPCSLEEPVDDPSLSLFRIEGEEIEAGQCVQFLIDTLMDLTDGGMTWGTARQYAEGFHAGYRFGVE